MDEPRRLLRGMWTPQGGPLSCIDAPGRIPPQCADAPGKSPPWCVDGTGEYCTTFKVGSLPLGIKNIYSVNKDICTSCIENELKKIRI